MLTAEIRVRLSGHFRAIEILNSGTNLPWKRSTKGNKNCAKHIHAVLECGTIHNAGPGEWVLERVAVAFPPLRICCALVFPELRHVGTC